MRTDFRIIGKYIGYAAVIAAALFIILDITCPVNKKIDYGQLIKAEDGTVIHAFLARDEQWRMNAGLNEITPELKKAIIYKEDKYFYYHPGVNLPAIWRAMANNLLNRKRTSGASTITMQVARMLEPKKRNYLNKVVEIFRALQLELHYSKEEILQLYLNLVPYGSNIQGVKAAALLYFDKSPGQLSLAEITALSIIPNKPNSLVMGKHNARIIRERNAWLKRFEQAEIFSTKTIHDALEEPLTAMRHDAPKQMPQLAWRLRMAYPTADEVVTTVSSRLQHKVEGIVTEYMNTLQLNNIHNCAVIIIDNATHSVKAYIGSPDFSDKAHHGEVDGVAAARSPGSTLKPALYALCMDMGLVTPKTMIADVPVNLDGYMPENYDLEFHGNIAAEDALKKSLNIPAVKLLNDAGPERFMKTLTSAGMTTLWNNRKQLGLSMILGGCTVRLDELSALYSAFANGGVYYPLTMIQANKQNSPASARIFSTEAAYMLSNIMTDLYRPDLPNLFDNARALPSIAWKTGTSYGRKDAWSIGFNKRFTIGVWVGNFDGTGVAVLNGAATATPLLFRLFNATDKYAGDEWLSMPAGVQWRTVCDQTGLPAEEYCTSTSLDYYIPGVSTNAKCNHLKETWLSADESFSYCTNCRPVAGFKTKAFPNISAELVAYYEQHHIPFEKIPQHNPVCSRTFEGKPPYITSLTHNATYIITDKGKQQLQLQCTASNDVQTVYWYINDKFFSSTAVGERVFFPPDDSNIKISCADDKGRNTDIRIKVQFI
jgi:penicillin-binding protein 1C